MNKSINGRGTIFGFLNCPDWRTALEQMKNDGKLYTWILRTVKPTLSSEEGCLVIRHGNLRNCRSKTLLSSELEHQQTYYQCDTTNMFSSIFRLLYLCTKCDMHYLIFDIQWRICNLNMCTCVDVYIYIYIFNMYNMVICDHLSCIY